MPIETTLNSIADLNTLWPTGADPKSDGDDHLRNIKTVLKAAFPAFTGPMPIAHDQVASKTYVTQAAFSAQLPGQAGNAGKVLGTDGTSAIWQPGLPPQATKAGKVLRTDGTNSAWTEVGSAGAAIASAATVNLDAATGDFVHITGTTGITAMTLAAGAARAVVFDAALVLTHSAALQLPTNANITTRAGDRAMLRGDAAGTILTHYQRADGTALVAPTIPAQTYALLATYVVSTPVATINFLNLFSTTYDRYVVDFAGLQVSSGSPGLLVSFASAGSVVATSNYFGPGSDATSMTAATSFATSMPLATSAFPANAPQGTMEIRNVNNATMPKGLGLRGSAQTTAYSREGLFTGSVTVSGLQIANSTAVNFTAGTIRIYGVSNS